MLVLKNDRVKFMEFKATSIGKQWDSYENLNPVYEQWDNFTQIYLMDAPESLQSGKFTGGIFLSWMVSEKAFLQSAIQGVLIALIFSFIILTGVTCNMQIAFLAIVSVAIVVFSVVTIMVFQGWELGVSESIAVVILIGLSVDYVVHLAQDYKHSAATHRSSKTKQALQEMGVSIFSGCVTTFLSGLALFGGKIITF